MDRQAILDDIRKLIDEADRAGSQSNAYQSVSQIMAKVYGNNYSNMTPEERQTAWENKFQLPSSVERTVVVSLFDNTELVVWPG